jgi:integrating conjugative element membrane protein (TIGR03747 family)
MAGRSDRDRPDKRATLTGTLIGVVFTVFFWLLITLLISIFCEFVGMYTLWLNAEPLHAVEMFHTELGYANAQVAEHLLFEAPRDKMVDAFEYLDEGFDQLSDWLSPVQDTKVFKHLTPSWELFEDYMLSAFYVFKVFVLRLSMLLLSLPIFILAAWVAAVDGLVERQLRIAGGARESNVLFDFAVKYAMGVIITTAIVYLSIPVAVNPLYAVLPGAILFFLLSRTSFMMYKKYI